MARSPNVREVAPVPSSDDQSVDVPTSADPVRQREPDPIVVQLRERMERLPHGHPSSPYNDDGSRKPPLPNLSRYELPIPGDPDYRPEPSKAVEADRLDTAQASDHVALGNNADEDPERTADSRRLWEVRPDAEPVTEDRKRLDQERAPSQDTEDKAAADEQPTPDSEADRHSDPEGEPHSGPDYESSPADQERLGDLDSQGQAEHRLSQITDRATERCRAAEGRDAEGNYGEHGLTPAMRRIESQLEYGHLADQTEKYALKDPARFKEKLAERVERFPNADPNDLATEIHDGVRYTFILDFDHYTASVGLAQSKLAEAGYDQIEAKPGWHGEEYKGVNSQWGDPVSGIRFEVQFHTSESWYAKQTTHEAYEAIRTNKASVEETESLRAYQREVSATIRIPLGALDIPAYKKGR